MKETLILIILTVVVITTIVLIKITREDNIVIENSTKNISSNMVQNIDIIKNEVEENDIKNSKVEDNNMIHIIINGKKLEVELEENIATSELKEKLKSGDIEVEVHEYGGFEMVGDLGFSLPREDKSIKTSAGDIVLYQGNQISIFFDSNSWSYTKLGKIKNRSSDELKTIFEDKKKTTVYLTK